MRDRIGDFEEFIQWQTVIGQYPSSPTDEVDGSRDSFDNETKLFLAKVDVLQQRIVGCKMLIDEMKVRHSAVLTQTVTNNRLEEDLDCLIKRIKSSTEAIHEEINNLKEESADDGKAFLIEKRIKTAQISVLQRIFQDLMHEYNKTQLQHRENCKTRIIRQLEITGTTKSDNEIETMLEQKDIGVFSQQLKIDTDEAKEVLKLVEQRHGDIIRLEKSLYELQDLFQEMATTVQNQSDLLDNIEQNVLDAHYHTQQAAPLLKAARRYHRKRCFYCCPCLYYCEIL